MIGVVGYLLIALGSALEWGLLRARGLPAEATWIMIAVGIVVAGGDAYRRDSRMFAVITVCTIIAGATLAARWWARTRGFSFG